MLPLLLVDTRDPEPDHDDWAWLGRVLSWLFPWPAIIAWLFIATIVIHGFVGMLFGYATIVVVAWRGSKAYPRWGGLEDYRQ